MLRRRHRSNDASEQHPSSPAERTGGSAVNPRVPNIVMAGAADGSQPEEAKQSPEHRAEGLRSGILGGLKLAFCYLVKKCTGGVAT